MRRLFGILFFVFLLGTSISKLSAVRADVGEVDDADLDILDQDVGIKFGGESDAASADPVVATIPYQKPSLSGFVWGETFDDDVFNRWVHSADPKFTGKWEHVERQKQAIAGDKGLRVGDASKFHGISSALNTAEFEANKDRPFVISYEVKFEEDLNCGGSYLKLFHTNNLTENKLTNFNNETPYVLMFGPDKCGATNKVHVIIKTESPVDGEWTEHHLKNPPRIPHGGLTHQYGLILLPSNEYAVVIDGLEVKRGFMVEDFEPSFSPSETIDDPEDKKPDDWVDDELIPDPEAVKPEDWDEDAPRRIPDPEAKMPEGWLKDEPLKIPDPSAQKPEDWDDEEDGDWEAPLVRNPKCESAPGCGAWEAPQIANPAYKGKWIAPKIKNPAFKGVWKPRQIPNPKHYTNEHPHALASFNAIGFEIWTVQHGALFDNIVIGRDKEAMWSFVDATWKVRHEVEEKMQKKSDGERKLDEEAKMSSSGFMDQALMYIHLMANEYPIGFPVGAVSLVLVTAYLLSTMFRRKPAPVTKDKKNEDAPEETEETDNADAKSEKSDKTDKAAARSKSRERSLSRGPSDKAEKKVPSSDRKEARRRQQVQAEE